MFWTAGEEEESSLLLRASPCAIESSEGAPWAAMIRMQEGVLWTEKDGKTSGGWTGVDKVSAKTGVVVFVDGKS